MQERISKDLIADGLCHNLIVESPSPSDGLIGFKIGDGCFFAPPEWDEAYVRSLNLQELADALYEILNDEPVNGETDDEAGECLYYKYFLEEALGELFDLQEQRISACDSPDALDGMLVTHYGDDEYQTSIPVKVSIEEMSALIFGEYRDDSDACYEFSSSWTEIVADGQEFPAVFEYDQDGIWEMERKYGTGNYITVFSWDD